MSLQGPKTFYECLYLLVAPFFLLFICFFAAALLSFSVDLSALSPLSAYLRRLYITPFSTVPLSISGSAAVCSSPACGIRTACVAMRYRRHPLLPILFFRFGFVGTSGLWRRLLPHRRNILYSLMLYGRRRRKAGGGIFRLVENGEKKRR
jgi:hypothetical protein